MIINEPQQEYCEHVFCDYYVDYGSLKKNKKILKSNFLAPKKIIHLNNPKLTQTSLKKDIINKNLIYVPDSFNGDIRHGPYREMDDRKVKKSRSPSRLGKSRSMMTLFRLRSLSDQ